MSLLLSMGLTGGSNATHLSIAADVHASTAHTRTHTHTYDQSVTDIYGNI